MNPRTCLILTIVAVLSLPACEEQPEEPKGAWTLDVVPSRIRGATVETMESAPPQVALNVSIDMPSPGYRVTMDGVAGPDANGRITAKITITPKSGMWPQVVTPTEVRLPLGVLDEGQYIVEVLEKRLSDPYRPVGAVLLRARGR